MTAHNPIKRRCLHCGMEAVSKRSPDDHRRFFKIIALAFDNWPETHYFQPDSAEHLRAWLIAHTEHRILKTVTLPDFPEHTEFVAILRAFVVETSGVDNVTKFGVWRGSTFQVAEPLSIDWDTVGQKLFNPIRDQVCGMIEDVLGTDCETLLREYGRAA